MTESYRVSHHARQRWAERVEHGSIDDHAAAITTAVRIGARSIRIASGHRLVIDPATGTVVTVLSPGGVPMFVSKMRRTEWNGA